MESVQQAVFQRRQALLRGADNDTLRCLLSAAIANNNSATGAVSVESATIDPAVQRTARRIKEEPGRARAAASVLPDPADVIAISASDDGTASPAASTIPALTCCDDLFSPNSPIFDDADDLLRFIDSYLDNCNSVNRDLGPDSTTEPGLSTTWASGNLNFLPCCEP